MKKTIALWMYRNEGGDVSQEKLKKLLEKENIKVINDFDMRECYTFNGKVYTKSDFDLSSVDLLYHMNADEQSAYQSDILRALELSGVKVINSWDSYTLARNKFWTNTLLKKNGINVPPSLFVNSKNAIALADKIFNEWESVIVKPLRRHGGHGIIKFDSKEQFIDYVDSVQDVFESFYIEKFIEFGEHDYRVEVFNGEVVCGSCRSLKTHSYKSNVSSGGQFSEFEPSEEFKKISILAAKLIDINFTIIDMI